MEGTDDQQTDDSSSSSSDESLFSDSSSDDDLTVCAAMTGRRPMMIQESFDESFFEHYCPPEDVDSLFRFSMEEMRKLYEVLKVYKSY